MQLFVYCILASINSMMDIMQFVQVFRSAAQYLVNQVNVFFPNSGIGQIRYAPEIVGVLMVLLVVYFFMGILWQFLWDFCACYLALVVYNGGRWFAGERR